MAEMLVEGTNANAIPKTVIPPPINPGNDGYIFITEKSSASFHK